MKRNYKGLRLTTNDKSIADQLISFGFKNFVVSNHDSGTWIFLVKDDKEALDHMLDLMVDRVSNPFMYEEIKTFHDLFTRLSETNGNVLDYLIMYLRLMVRLMDSEAGVVTLLSKLNNQFKEMELDELVSKALNDERLKKLLKVTMC
jgi:hypothetical protein